MQPQHRSRQIGHSAVGRNSPGFGTSAHQTGDKTPRTVGRLRSEAFKFLPEPQTIHGRQRYSAAFPDSVGSSRMASGATSSRLHYINTRLPHGFAQVPRISELSEFPPQQENKFWYVTQNSGQTSKVQQHTQRHSYPGPVYRQSSWSNGQMTPQVKSIHLHDRTARSPNQSSSPRYLINPKNVPYSSHDGPTVKEQGGEMPVSGTPIDHYLRQQWSSDKSGIGMAAKLNQPYPYQSQEKPQSDVSSESGFLTASSQSSQHENENISMQQHTSTPMNSRTGNHESNWENIGDNYYVPSKPIGEARSLINIAFTYSQSSQNTLYHFEAPDETFSSRSDLRADHSFKQNRSPTRLNSGQTFYGTTDEGNFAHRRSDMKWNKESEGSAIGSKAQRQQQLELYYLKEGRPIDHTHPNIYRAPSRTLFENKEQMLRKVELGHRNTEGRHKKVILLLGATGSGKTSLINAMFNYIVDVRWSDEYRLKLIDEKTVGQETNQAKSQTAWITSYTIHHSKTFTIPYTLTVIDTPGFADTSGIMKDKKIINQLRLFFETGGYSGIDRIDAVGFVANSTLPRLTPTQRYIMDSILSLFGKNIEENIFVLFTNSDGTKPGALSAFDEADIPYQSYFLFNNADIQDRNSRLGEMYWNIGRENYKSFFMSVGAADPKSLSLSREVMKSRHEQEIALQNLQRSITLNLGTLENLKNDLRILKHYQHNMERNQHFTYEAIEQYVRRQRVHNGYIAINCSLSRNLL